MKLSKIYSNKPEVFEAMDFVPGLNVVLAEIRLPENKKKDTHNLGKTTLGRMLNFCLLARRHNDFFLFRHPHLFAEFVFFIEIELRDASYLTLRRSVKEASKISFKKHEARGQDFSVSQPNDWDHYELPFDRAKAMLDGLLSLQDIKPYDFRKGLGYLLRSQDDFLDVFQLRKFAGRHANWKPFLAHVLGFDSESIAKYYGKEEELKNKQSDAESVKKMLGGVLDDISKIEGLLAIKKREADKKQQLLDAFDFGNVDKMTTKRLVDDLDEEIADLNSRRYSLSLNRKRILASLESDQILFDPEHAQQVFTEVGVLFAGQIKKDFDQLIAFNRAITEERRGYLQEERREVESELKSVNEKLIHLGNQRSELLAFLSSTDVFDKYKQVSNDLIKLRAEITSLDNQRSYLHQLQRLRTEIRSIEEEKIHLQTEIETDVEYQNADADSRFSAIRLSFNEIVEEVIDRKALLSVAINSHGHLEFKAEILDEQSNATSAGLGHTYGKLLCIAFDLAVIRAHLDGGFPRFVYHDGAFESLDDRKKEKLLGVIRSYASFGIQPVITLIDSDLPKRPEGDEPVFEESEIILKLHDEGKEGRLFKMDPW